MKANYRITVDAQSDVTNIYLYGLTKYGEAQADKYFNALYDRFEQLAEQPFLYPAVDHIRDDYRVSVCGVDSIYYRIVDDGIEIMNVLGRQDREKWLK